MDGTNDLRVLNPTLGKRTTRRVGKTTWAPLPAVCGPSAAFVFGDLNAPGVFVKGKPKHNPGMMVDPDCACCVPFA